jgi:hypothetical protein
VRHYKKPSASRHTITLPADLSEWAETQRGDVPFSTFIRRALELYREDIKGKLITPSAASADAHTPAGGSMSGLLAAEIPPSFTGGAMPSLSLSDSASPLPD